MIKLLKDWLFLSTVSTWAQLPAIAMQRSDPYLALPALLSCIHIGLTVQCACAMPEMRINVIEVSIHVVPPPPCCLTPRTVRRVKRTALFEKLLKFAGSELEGSFWLVRLSMGVRFELFIFLSKKKIIIGVSQINRRKSLLQTINQGLNGRFEWMRTHPV